MKTPFRLKPSYLFAFLLCLVLLVPLAGCKGRGKAKGNTSTGAVQAYLEALVAKDANKLSELSCKTWEPQAKQELDSFAAVTPTLKDLNCTKAGKGSDATLVSCTGKIVASYNGENQEINLADRVFKAVEEGGDWRMCGYK